MAPKPVDNFFKNKNKLNVIQGQVVPVKRQVKSNLELGETKFFYLETRPVFLKCFLSTLQGNPIK